MSDLLGALLPAVEAAAGRTLRAGDVDLVVVHNTGPIPPVRHVNGGSGAPGFNVVVAERGQPIYFCKCRPAGDPAIAREGAVGEALSRDSAMATHVATMRLAHAGAMDVLVVRRLPGRPYTELLEKQSDDDWLSSVERVVGLVERMGACLSEAMPAMGDVGDVRIMDEAQWALVALEEEHGLARERVEALRSALARGGAVRARPQHGDLWPPNVLVDRATWYIIDLESFGRVRVPLYDLFHMLHICSDFRRPETGDGTSWVEKLVRGDASEAGALALVRRVAERHALSPAAAFAAFVYYLVDATARVRARGAWTADWREYLAQAARLADLVIDGVATPERLLTSGRA